MGNDLVKFDPTKLMESVRDRIKAEFVGMIPDEEWQKLVKAEIDSFFEIQADGGYSREQWRPKKTSHFGEVVRDCLKEETKARLKAYLSSEEFQYIWEGDQTKPGHGVKDVCAKILADHLPSLIEALLSGKIQEVIQQMRMQSGW